MHSISLQLVIQLLKLKTCPVRCTKNEVFIKACFGKFHQIRSF